MGQWEKADAENNELYMQQLEQAKKHSAADHVFFSAAQKARLDMAEELLLPTIDEQGNHVYGDRQGNKAACQAREDVAVIAAVQLAIIRRLDRNRNYLAVIVAMLAYIAFEMK